MIFCRFLSIYLLSGSRAKAEIGVEAGAYAKAKVEIQEIAKVEMRVPLSLIEASQALQWMKRLIIWLAR